MFKIALILAISAICFAADQLPASTAGAVKAYDAEMAKAKAEFDKRDDAAKKVLVVALKKVQDAETKAGNLEGALAIKKRIDELSPKSGDLLGDKVDIAKLIIGKWDVSTNGGYWDSKENGKVESNWGPATWKVVKNTIVVHQSVDHVISFNQNDDDKCEVTKGSETWVITRHK
ncbi:exported hypothetical protein [Azospirillaceae bacterium]